MQASPSPKQTYIANNVQSDKLRLLYQQSFQAVFISGFIASLYAGILWNEINTAALLIWLAAILLSIGIRLNLFISYRKAKPTGSEVLNWELPYAISLIFSSLVWGLGCVLITYSEAMIYQIISFYFLMGMAGGALAVYSSIRYLAILTLAALLIPSTLWFIIQGTNTSLLMALASSVFFLSAIRSTKILVSTLNKTFHLSHELAVARDTAERLARTDTLTELNNRRAFTELSEIQIQYCDRHHNPVSLLLLDIDFFKRVNDFYGHASGDLALKQIASTLKQTVRISDICGRIGGEEFAILFPNTGFNEAITIAEKIRVNIETMEVKTANKSFSMTASIGVATNIYNLEELLKAADKAMYKAKQSGRNQVSGGIFELVRDNT